MDQQFITGVLKLNTCFPRLHGDIGNSDSLRGKVVFETIADANPGSVITGKPLPASLVDAFVTGARTLIHHRVDLITTSCGFLLPLQTTLARLSQTPVLTSSLLLLPLLQSMHGNHIGILTFDQEKLLQTRTGLTMPDSIAGLQRSDCLRQTIAEDRPTIERDQALADVLDCASRLLKRWPLTQAILLECTNLSPYKHSLRHHTGRPVYDLVDAIHWHQTATHRRLST